MPPKNPTAPMCPNLPRESQDQGILFRLNKISEIRDFLKNEADQRDKLRRKYKILWIVFYVRAQVSESVAVGSGVGALATLASRVAAPVSISLGGISIGAGLICTACVAFRKATMKKLEKHKSIKWTAESTLNTVDDLVSKALE